MNEEEDIRGGATDEQINQAYKEKLILDQQDPRTDEKFLEERAKKNKIKGFDASESMLDEEFEAQKQLQEDDPTAEQQFTEANRGFDILYEIGKTADKYLGTKGALGELFDFVKGKAEGRDVQFPVQLLLKEQKDLPKDPTKALIPPVSQTNVITRFFGEDISPNAIEFLKGLVMRKGGFSDEDEDRIRKIQEELKIADEGGQLNLFFGETDEFLSQQYANLRKQEGNPIPTKLSTDKARRQVTRKIKVSDLDLILQEFPDIPKDKANEYIQAIREEERGENLVAGSPRKGGNGKGLIGTLRWLNSVAMAPNSKTPSDINVKDVADELSAEFNQIITIKTLDNIIQEKGSIPVEIADKEIMQVTDLESLIKAYVRRVERYNSIPAFEAGHVFAAKNIMEDMNIPKGERLANYKGNLEPEIARSIYSMVDDEALTDLLKGTDLEAVVIGNRGRRDKSDPDKVIAALYGRDYGLRESFLNFVYPERSLKNKIRDDLKSTFTDIYKEEMELALSDFDARGGGKGIISPRVLDVIRNRVLRDRVMPYFEEEGLQEVMEALTLISDKISGRDMVADEDELLTRNLLKKQEIRRKGEMK